jgi:hypothetical protein
MNKLLYWTLRIGVFGTFSGHGTIAIYGNEKWLPYLALAGIEPPAAFNAMFVIGIADWMVALITLLRPSRYILIYAVIWAFATALARPLSGEPWLAFVERAANWAAPLALYFMLYSGNHIHSMAIEKGER